MPQRIVLGASALATMLMIAWGDGAIAETFQDQTGWAAEVLSCGSLIPLASTLACLFGCGEMLRILRGKGATPCTGVAFIMTAVCMLAPWVAAGLGAPTEGANRAIAGTVFAVALGCTLTGLNLVLRRRVEGSLRDFAATIAVFCYVGVLPSFAIQIRSGWAGPGAQGAWFLLILLFVIKASDIGGYLTGTFLGRHKLIPQISPGKSVEGAIGAVVLSGVAAVVLFQLVSVGAEVPIEMIGTGESVTNHWSHNSIPAFLFGSTLATVAICGDLLESCFKRDAGIKDSGQVLPRFGGVLDIIDSPLLALPVAWMILTLAG